MDLTHKYTPTVNGYTPTVDNYTPTGEKHVNFGLCDFILIEKDKVSYKRLGNVANILSFGILHSLAKGWGRG